MSARLRFTILLASMVVVLTWWLVLFISNLRAVIRGGGSVGIVVLMGASLVIAAGVAITGYRRLSRKHSNSSKE